VVVPYIGLKRICPLMIPPTGSGRGVTVNGCVVGIQIPSMTRRAKKTGICCFLKDFMRIPFNIIVPMVYIPIAADA
jgi:hypothetical protein